jgi:hypothetical protein
MKLFRRLSPANKGYTETVKKFAFYPKKMTNGNVIWLEFYEEKRIWSYYDPTTWSTIGYYGWRPEERKEL